MHMVTESVVGQNPCRKESRMGVFAFLLKSCFSRGLKVLAEVSSELAKLKEPSWTLGLGGKSGNCCANGITYLCCVQVDAV